MGFFLFILVTAILLIRPQDFVPGLEANLYLVAIVPCILVSWHKLVPQLTTAGLRGRPVFVFAVGILLILIVSSLMHGQLDAGLDPAVEFLKVLIFYLLMLAQVDSPRRLKMFLVCLVGIILIPTLLSVLNFHGYVSIAAFKPLTDGGGIDRATGEIVEITRLQGTGTFADPNDVCEIVNLALILSLCGLLDRGRGLARVIWLAPIAVFGEALVATQSRGGLVGLAVGLMVLFRSRFGTKKAVILAGLVLPLLLIVFGGGRQTSLSTSEGTAQGRIQLWNAGFEMLRVSRGLGVGLGGFFQSEGHVAHSAVVQISAELGLLGGILFLGQYYYCLKNLNELGANGVDLPDPEMRRLQPFVLGSVASFFASEMSVTHPTTLITYVVFGLGTAFIKLAAPIPPLRDLTLSRSLIRRVTVFSVLYLLVLYVFVKLSLRY